MAKKKARTEFGRELAKLRIDFNETGQDMAAKLGMSNSNLHAIEMGSTGAGFDLIEKIKTLYGKDLEEAFIRGGGVTRLDIDVASLNEDMRDIAVKVWKVSQGLLTAEEFFAEVDDFGVPGIETTTTAKVTGKPADGPEPPKDEAPGWKPPPVPDDVMFLTEDELSGLDDL